MNLLGSLVFAAAAVAGCASEVEAAPAPAPALEEPPPSAPAPAPAPQEPPPKDEQPPAPKDPAPPAPKEAPPQEAPPKEPPKDPPKEAPPKTSPEARDLLERASKRQGTAEMVGPKSPDRFRAFFATVVLHSDNGDRLEVSDTNEAFALPTGTREARLRSEWVAERKRVVLGHNGRFGWMKEGPAEPRTFTNRERDAEDIRDLEQRRRMLRLALRGFFLGGLADGAAPITLLPDEEKDFPVGHQGKSRTAKCRVLERAPDPAAGEPKLRIYLDVKSLDPVAILLFAGRPEDPALLLTLDFDPPAIHDKKAYPTGVRVPDWLELFEIPAAPPAVPVLRIQAGLKGLDIDPVKVPDSLFEVPK